MKTMFKMNRLFATLTVVLLAGGSLFAQQVPMYSFNYYNQFVYNPALAGINDYGQVYAMYRKMWNGIPDAPSTVALTMDGPLKKKNIGLGVSVFQDKAALFNVTGGQVSYRYGLELANEHNVSFGLSLGFINNGINQQGIKAKHGDDVLINSNYENATGFDATFGINYNWQTLNIGLSVPQILANDLAYSPVSGSNAVEAQYNLSRHFIGHANYEFELSEDKFWLQPQAIIRYTPNAPFQYDINIMADYKRLVWIGAMYRSAYAATFSAGLKLAQSFVIGYGYDYLINGNQTYTNGAHEVIFGYQFGGGGRDTEEIKKRLKDIDKKTSDNKTKIDSVEQKTDENRQDIDKNRDDIDNHDDDLEQMKKDFETFKKIMEQQGKVSVDEDGNIVEGSVYSFSNVYFGTADYRLDGVNTSELDDLAGIMKENANMKIEIAGHADSRGSEAFNQRLAERRAESVRDYLIEQGVPASQMTVKSYGEGDPLSSDELSKNRRVEFKITGQ